MRVTLQKRHYKYKDTLQLLRNHTKRLTGDCLSQLGDCQVFVNRFIKSSPDLHHSIISHRVCVSQEPLNTKNLLSKKDF